ncbi:MAG: DNA recombination protein RmuC [Oscillospiraceae bacterium]|nr:DNA recombination protein RmuC [Oscillospiraceae bacterium]
MTELFAILAFIAAVGALVVAVLILQHLRRNKTQDNTPVLLRYIGDEFARSRQEIGQGQALQRSEIARQMEVLRNSNEQKLEQMRATVDEKLQTTLERRLAESFKSVSEHLDHVQRGLGEMKTLAADVGGLKKALTNVKIRGTFGEVQLERILEQMLHPGQYERNVAVVPDSQRRVDFALRLPEGVWMPIDSKFPTEDYERLMEGMELGDKDIIELARRNLAARLRGFAKDIAEKYINPPHTTNFAILFLPTEGLYAEVTQHPELFESLQRDYGVAVTGPSTLSAYLNALQMGFKTLAIEQRSVEVWKVLGAVRTEFETFAVALDSAQKKIRAADSELDKLVGTRTNVMTRKLREVERLPESEIALLLE